MKDKTIEQIEKDIWGEPPYNSYLVKTCFALRRKQLCDFTPEDLRIMIGQKMSLGYLIPIALEFLENDILAEGDFYPGDLYENVNKLSNKDWVEFPDLKLRFEALKKKNHQTLTTEGLL